MDFLKELLDEELYAQLKAAIDQHNGNEDNKDNQIKLGNLGGGEYVSKAEYDSLQELLNGKETELTGANDLIEQLKKATKGDESLQEKITSYEAENAQLQAQLAQTKLQSAVKVALLSEKAVDVDYLTFKLNESLKEKGETLELDENDNIKDWKNQLENLKTQFPKMFESLQNNGYVPIGSKGLPKGATDQETEPKSLGEALKMKYEQNN